MKRGSRVYVKWLDISASLHTDEACEPVEAESVGWIIRNNKKFIELATSRYVKGCDCKDRIAILKGCIEKMEEI